jgi:sulfite exporter TauE/SafE
VLVQGVIVLVQGVIVLVQGVIVLVQGVIELAHISRPRINREVARFIKSRHFSILL